MRILLSIRFVDLKLGQVSHTHRPSQLLTAIPTKHSSFTIRGQPKKETRDEVSKEGGKKKGEHLWPNKQRFSIS